MIFKIYTLFPDFFISPLNSGLMGKAVNSGIINFKIIDIREYSEDKFKRCDDYPFGGGSGMVLTPGPLFRAITENENSGSKIIYASPSGKGLNQTMVKEMSSLEEISVICGHYEGIDQRVIDTFVDYEISIGDYVLSGGEYAALVIADSVARYLPGFMSNSTSLDEESFESDLLEYPHYSRPAEFMGLKVPDVLTGGNHQDIAAWRYNKRIEKTKGIRPDLYKKFLKRKLLGE